MGTHFHELGVGSRKSQKFLPRENFPLCGIQLLLRVYINKSPQEGMVYLACIMVKA